MLLGFKKRFIQPIKIGTKVHTMRNKRKIKPKIGETLHMYTALRTKHCELITNKEKLISKQKVRVHIQRNKVVTEGKNNGFAYITKVLIDGRKIEGAELEQFVKFDGFENITDFASFWFLEEKKTKLVVGGIMDLFHWTDLRY